MTSLNGGYAMIKYNSTQEELQIAYRSKKPVLCYDENRRAHWAVIEETATESVDEETQEPITIYEYSYRLIDEASGSEVHLYKHDIIVDIQTSSHKLFLQSVFLPTATVIDKAELEYLLSTDHDMLIIYEFYSQSSNYKLDYIGHLKMFDDSLYYSLVKIGSTGESQGPVDDPTIVDTVTQIF